MRVETDLGSRQREQAQERFKVMKSEELRDNGTGAKRKPGAGWLALALVGVVGVLAAIAYWVLQGAGDGGNPIAHAINAPSIGDPNAPVTIVQYADFQCPYCRLFALDIQPELIKEFVDTGRARLEWRHFPVFGAFSTLAAHAAACAHEQGAFWAYHDALYAKLEAGLSPGAKRVDTLVAIADSVGLESASFKACVVERRYAAQIRADLQSGRRLGVVGTPSFVVNGILLAGAQPLETWRRIMEILDPEGGV